MGDNYPSGIRRERVSAPIVESIGTILRDPPRAIHTRKFEPVEAGDVSYMFRENPDRYSDSIRQFGSHRNEMCSMMYGGGAPIASSSGVVSNRVNDIADRGFVDMATGRSPYSVIRAGAFRPPMMNRDDIEPLSRLRRPQPAAQTNPGLIHNPLEYQNGNPPVLRDRDTIRSSLQPNVSIREFQFNAPPPPVHTGIVIRPSIAVATGNGSISTAISVVNMGTQEVEQHIKDRPVISYLSPIFSVAIQNGERGYEKVEMSQQDKINVAVNAEASLPIAIPTPDGKMIKLKDYRWSVVQANPSSPSVLVLEERHALPIHFREFPHYSMVARASHRLDQIEEVNLPTLNQKATVSVGSLPSAHIGMDRSMANFTLPARLKVGGFENHGQEPSVERFQSSLRMNTTRAELLKRAQRTSVM